MKTFLLISVLFITSCKKEKYFNLKNPANCYDSCSQKTFQKSLDGIEYLCPIDSIAFTNNKNWRSYLHKCVTLDSSSIENIPSGKYKVLIGFEISEFGKAINPVILNTPKYDFDKKALLIFNSFKGKWNLPAEDEDGGKIVYRQPIVFEIEDE